MGVFIAGFICGILATLFGAFIYIEY